MRRAALLLMLPASLLGACGTTEIDVDKAESFIGQTVADQVGARVESVECPEGLTAEEGATFECTVMGDDGSSGRAQVRQKDDEGNVSVTAPFLPVRNLEEQMAGDIAQQVGGEVVLDCPEIIIGEKGGTFECDASGDGDDATVAVTQRDDQGNVRYEIER